MHIIALVPSVDHVSVRYRVQAFVPYLQQAGHEIEFCNVKSWWSFWQLAPRLKQADAVIVQRRLFPELLLHRLRRLARVLIYDFDDAVFLRDSYHRKGLHDIRRLGRFSSMMRAADLVVAGNDFLAKHAGRWTKPDNVITIPTCVDTARYPLARHDARPLQMVWIGSSSTLQGIQQIRPWFEDIGDRIKGLSLKLVCDRSIQLEKLPVVLAPWAEATEAGDLASAQVGISWVPDDPWSQGKCGLKVVQYMAAGLPVIANPVGVQCHMVRHGENGFLVETVEQWLDALRQLQDPDLRRRMGQAGRQRALKEFDVKQGAQGWLELLSSLQRSARLAS